MFPFDKRSFSRQKSISVFAFINTTLKSVLHFILLSLSVPIKHKQ